MDDNNFLFRTFDFANYLCAIVDNKNKLKCHYTFRRNSHLLRVNILNAAENGFSLLYPVNIAQILLVSVPVDKLPQTGRSSVAREVCPTQTVKKIKHLNLWALILQAENRLSRTLAASVNICSKVMHRQLF